MFGQTITVYDNVISLDNNAAVDLLIYLITLLPKYADCRLLFVQCSFFLQAGCGISDAHQNQRRMREPLHEEFHQ